MGSEDQSLIVHSKKTIRNSHHPRGKHFHKDNTRKYLMRKDTMLENVLEIEMALTIRRETRKYIMLTLQRMMHLLERESKKKVKTLQVML